MLKKKISRNNNAIGKYRCKVFISCRIATITDDFHSRVKSLLETRYKAWLWEGKAERRIDVLICDSLQSSKVNKIITSVDENRQSKHKTLASGEIPSLFFFACVSLSPRPVDIMHRCRTGPLINLYGLVES